MKTFYKCIAKTSAIVALAFTGFSAQAAVPLPDFTVDPDLGTEGSLVGATAPFEADRINGSYEEIITFTSATTFETTLIWTASIFRSDDDTVDVGPLTTGLQVDYDLYALFQGSGTWFSDAAGDHFLFNDGGTFELYYDNFADTSFSAPADGTSLWGTGSDVDDKLLLSGTLFGAPDSQGVQLSGGGQNQGSFGTIGDIVLTEDGANYFIDPDPFYELALTSGDFTRFTPQAGATVTGITGKLSVDFENVPEPTTLSLLGLGLLGLGVRRRK